MTIKERRERAAQLGLTRVDNPESRVPYMTPQSGDETARIKDPNDFIEQVVWNSPHGK